MPSDSMALSEPPRLPKLSGLPLELITEIARRLDWTDVLTLRQTCKLLYGVSKLRPVWETLLYRAQSSFVIPVKLERPIEHYAIEELEHKALQLLTAKTEWLTKTPIERRYLLDNITVASSHLVEGGRWFLIATNKGSLLYYDLDKANDNPHTLVADQFSPKQVVMCVERDVHESLLTLTVVLHSSDYAYDSDESDHSDSDGVLSNEFQVWKVSLSIDNFSTMESFLSARHMVSFTQKNDHASTVCCLSLCGKQLGYGVYYGNAPRTLPYVIVISDWTTIRGSIDSHPKRIIRHAGHPRYLPFEIQLMPNGTLWISASTSGGSSRLYDLQAIQRTTSSPSPPWLAPLVGTPHIWQNDAATRMRVRGIASRQFYHAPSNSIRFVLEGQGCSWGLCIRLDAPPVSISGDDNVLSKLADHDLLGQAYSLGSSYHYTVLYHWARQQLLFLKHLWPDDQDTDDPSPVRWKTDFIIGLEAITHHAVDGSSGRLVFCTSEYFSLLDLARYTLHTCM